MSTFGLVNGVKRPRLSTSTYTIEYTSSEHRGIIMYSETIVAESATEALAHAKLRFSGMKEKHGARGYRVKDADGSSHGSD